METDTVYFARRALQERLAAGKATCRLASQSHLELAERFEELAAGIANHERNMGFHITGTNPTSSREERMSDLRRSPKERAVAAAVREQWSQAGNSWL